MKVSRPAVLGQLRWTPQATGHFFGEDCNPVARRLKFCGSVGRCGKRRERTVTDIEIAAYHPCH